MQRRTFIRKSAAVATAAGLGNWESLAAANTALPFARAEGFSLRFMATNWGFQGSREAFCQKAAGAGYDGIEIWTPQEDKDRDEWLALARQYKLSVGLLCGNGDPDFQKHFGGFEASLNRAVAMKPLYINCHSGRDWFSFEQNSRFVELTTRTTAGSGVPIYHETHRGRMLFAAHITRQFIEKLPGLRLTLDISHWCNVHESLLGDQAETVQLALSRVDHIHTRVGHAEGPQVNDPRAPEWENAVKAHLAWWDKVVELKAAAGQPLTMLTEFGPPHYLPALPYTMQPVADQWAINVYMKDLLKKRYS